MVRGVRSGLEGPGGHLEASAEVKRWAVMLAGALRTMLEHWLGG